MSDSLYVMPETLQILKHSGIYYRIALFAV